MIGKRGGEWSKAGTYWDISTGEFIGLPEEGGILPGDSEARYVRAPLPLVVVSGPLIGLGYVVFLPLIGIVIVGQFLAQKAVGMLARMVQAAIQIRSRRRCE